MKKLLVIGAGFLQSFIIRKAKEKGVYVLAIDKNPNSIGFKYADQYEVIDIVDQESCLEYAKTMNIDGVLTAATDYGVLSAAYIAQQMNLPGLDYDVAKVIKDKYSVRRILSESDISNVSQYYMIEKIEDIEKISSKIEFPVIVKPCDGSGSKATTKVETLQDLKNASIEAMKSSLTGKVLIEDFIEGKEYGVETLVYNGEIHVLAVLGKYMSTPPAFAELGHYFPSNLSIEEKVKSVAEKAIKALGINFGAVNMDVLVTNDNRIFIIDVGARMGGNLIGSHIIPFATGIDYMANLVNMSLGNTIDLNETINKEKFIETRLLVLRPGIIKEIPDFNFSCFNDVEIYPFLEKGKEIKEYRSNLDGCGYIFSKGNDKQELVNKVERILLEIDNSIVRESPYM